MTDASFPTEINLQNARAVAELLAGRLESDPSVAVAGEHLLAADVAGIQILLAAHKTATERKAQFSVTYSRDGALHQALTALGLCDAAGALAMADHPFIEIKAAT